MPKLLASSSTLAGITQLCREYFASSSIELHEDTRSGGVVFYFIVNSRGPIDRCRVILKAKRYRFEMED